MVEWSGGNILGDRETCYMEVLQLLHFLCSCTCNKEATKSQCIWNINVVMVHILFHVFVI